MTVSGSFDFDLNTLQICNAALRKLGVVSQGDQASAVQSVEARQALNVMVKAWRGIGVHLWDLDWITQGLTASSVVLGTDSVDYECIKAHTSAAATRPVTGANYMSYWKALTTTAGSAWVTATDYVAITEYDLNTNIVAIDKAIVREDTDTKELYSLTRDGFFALPDRTSEGKPTHYYFERKATPKLHLYPSPDSTTDYVIELLVYRYSDDFDANANTSDFPVEWLKALIYNLAVDLAPEYGLIEGKFYSILKKEAEDAFIMARFLDEETGDTNFSPDLQN